jgi:Tfp pilus assembly protein PilZ
VKVRYSIGGQEQEGEARELSTLGTFVASLALKPPARSRLALTVGPLGSAVALDGEVVDVCAEGFAVAFQALAPDTLDRLGRLIGAIPADAEEASPAAADEQPEGSLDVEGEDWIPPIGSQILKEWLPSSPVPAAPQTRLKGTLWEGMPTIAAPAPAEAPEPEEPPSQPPTPPAAAAPAPAQGKARASMRIAITPEDQARAYLTSNVPSEAPAVVTLQPKRTRPIQPPIAPVPETAAEPSPGQPQEPERRQAERFDRSIPVSFDNLTSLIKEFTHNISFGGLFVYTDRPLKAGDGTVVTLIHPVHGERLSLLARVAHASSAPSPDPISGVPRFGVGVEFKLPQDELKRVLSDFISSHQKPSAAPVSSQIVQEARAVLNRGARSYFALLGVPDQANPDEIRRAYFALVDRFHPDRHYDKVGETDRRILEELFRRLTTAYEELTR